MSHWGGALLLAAVTRGRLRQLCGHALRYWFEICVDDSARADESSEEGGLSGDDGLGLTDEEGGLPLAATAVVPGGSVPYESLAASAFGRAPTAGQQAFGLKDWPGEQ